MSHPAPIARMTYAEYLLAEATSQDRHEFLGGNVYAMAGGTPQHGALAAAVIAALTDALRGRPCRVFTSDVRVRVPETGLSTYPDVSVVCTKLETDADDPHAITNPVVLVEVLSESTEAYDRGPKAAHYRKIAALREYVYVACDEPRIEVVRRISPTGWALYEARAGERIELASLGVSLAVDAIYADPLGGSPAAG